MRTVALVGSTGSIGRQAVEVVRAEAGRYEVVALGAHRSVDVLVEQAAELRPAVVAVADEQAAAGLAGRLPRGTELRAGAGALASIATEADVVVNGVVGFAGLPVTMAALAGGRRLALANKESLIAAGPVVQSVRHTPGAEIIPVDSEHCAVHQCLRAGRAGEVRRLVLTASGGPFRGWPAADLVGVTPAAALAHPTWQMGPKITIDSSTLMNKGLEVIEAHELFGLAYDAIEVVVHPQSVVHSMVEFSDGATIAQLSEPDMRLPLAYALGWPDRSPVPFGSLDWAEARRLDFEPPDTSTFRCLALASAAGRLGETAPATLNAANEVAVAAFLDGAIAWTAIAEVIEECLDAWEGTKAEDLDVVLAVDAAARERARASVDRRSNAA
ncbi:MAG TPA: 1-deoxy-D-xylulose-5-phosphate reductoisomerase [Acidimicrobiales bacterium]|nr:1-deoxy-D-xylulose-5-phosphate reductoisomerase [Acidimicrobiales bacterium]